MNRPVPLLILTCTNCHADMPRSVAGGLRIGDGEAVVAAGHVQVCRACGYEHRGGEVVKFRMGRVNR